ERVLAACNRLRNILSTNTNQVCRTNNTLLNNKKLTCRCADIENNHRTHLALKDRTHGAEHFNFKCSTSRARSACDIAVALKNIVMDRSKEDINSAHPLPFTLFLIGILVGTGNLWNNPV